MQGTNEGTREPLGRLACWTWYASKSHEGGALLLKWHENDQDYEPIFSRDLFIITLRTYEVIDAHIPLSHPHAINAVGKAILLQLFFNLDEKETLYKILPDTTEHNRVYQ